MLPLCSTMNAFSSVTPYKEEDGGKKNVMFLVQSKLQRPNKDEHFTVFPSYIHCCCDLPLPKRRHLGQREVLQDNPQIPCGLPPVNNAPTGILCDKGTSVKPPLGQYLMKYLLMSSGFVLSNRKQKPTRRETSNLPLYGWLSS